MRFFAFLLLILSPLAFFCDATVLVTPHWNFINVQTKRVQTLSSQVSSFSVLIDQTPSFTLEFVDSNVESVKFSLNNTVTHEDLVAPFQVFPDEKSAKGSFVPFPRDHIKSGIANIVAFVLKKDGSKSVHKFSLIMIEEEVIAEPQIHRRNIGGVIFSSLFFICCGLSAVMVCCCVCRRRKCRYQCKRQTVQQVVQPQVEMQQVQPMPQFVYIPMPMMPNQPGNQQVFQPMFYPQSIQPNYVPVCSIGLIMGKSLLAKYRISPGKIALRGRFIPISQEVASVLAEDTSNDRFLMGLLREDVKADGLTAYGTTTYALRHRGGYQSLLAGICSSWLELIYWFFRSMFQMFMVPDKFARKYGAFGCVWGLLVWPFYFAYSALMMFIVFIDRQGVAIANNFFEKQWLYFIDTSAVAKVYRDMSSLSSGVPVSDLYVRYIKDARSFAIEAHNMFDACGPSFPREHYHWLEADIEQLISKVGSAGQSKFSEEELNALKNRMEWAKTRMEKISFNRFCLFVGEALKDRFKHIPSTHGEKTCSITEAADCYLT